MRSLEHNTAMWNLLLKHQAFVYDNCSLFPDMISHYAYISHMWFCSHVILFVIFSQSDTLIRDETFMFMITLFMSYYFRPYTYACMRFYMWAVD